MKTPASNFFESDLTPVIAIVFQLLALFIIAVNFENTRADERAKLPVDGFAKPPESKHDRELMLNVSYTRTRTGAIASGPHVFHNGDPVPLEKISPLLEQQAKIFTAQAKNPQRALDDVAVLIRADADVPTGMVQELIERCQAAKFSKFSLQASQKQD